MIDSNTKILLTFRKDAVTDECGNTWTTVGSPKIGAAHSKFGSALQLDGASYIELTTGIVLGGWDFTVDFWAYVDATSQGGARIFSTDPLLMQIRCPFNSSMLRLCHNQSPSLSGTSVTSLDSGFDPTGKLTHFAIISSWSEGWIGLFVNGKLMARNFNVRFDRKAIKFQLGYASGTSSNYFLTGAISEFRVSDGIARWIKDDDGKYLLSFTVADDGVQLFEPPTRSYLIDESQADTARSLSFRLTENGEFDTARRITMRAFADTSRIIKHIVHEETAVDTIRRLGESATVETTRTLKKKERAIADTLIRPLFIMNYPPTDTDTGEGSGSSPGDAPDPSTAQAPKHTVTDQTILSLDITFSELTLSDRYSFQTANPNWEIGYKVSGRLLDYDFSFLVESISSERGIFTVTGMYDQDQLLYSHIFSEVKYNMKTGEAYGTGTPFEILNPRVITFGPRIVRYYGAQYFLAEIATYFGLSLVLNFEDFLPYQNFAGSNITYQEMISTLFGWTNRVPRRQINVFIRGKTIYAIQRGMEEKTFDISDIPHTEPRIAKKLIRSMYNNPFRNVDDDDRDKPETPDIYGEWTDEEIAVPFTGTIDFGYQGSGHSLRYTDGLLMRESSWDNGSTENFASTSYGYIDIYPKGTTAANIMMKSVKADIYLNDKTQTSTSINWNDNPATKTVSRIQTDYVYKRSAGGDLYLTTELEWTTTRTYERITNASGNPDWSWTDSETHTRKTFHVPLGNGWYGTSVTVDGEPQGSSISQGAPGNKVSPYTVNEVQKTLTIRRKGDPEGDADADTDTDGDSDSDDEDESYEEWRSRLSPILDTSFPVQEWSMLVKLSDEIYWMNRKIEETVELDLIIPVVKGVPTFTHVVDFTERIVLNGAEYFLVSNRLTLKPRELKQRLSLIRWYEQ